MILYKPTELLSKFLLSFLCSVRDLLLGSQFLRFLVVGAVKTAITYLIYIVFLYLISPYWSYFVAFLASILPSYYLNLKFTFRSQHSREKIFSYPLILIFQFLLGILVFHISLKAGVSEQVAPFFAIAASSPAAFFISRWTISGGKHSRNPVLFLSISAFIVSIAAVYGALTKW